MNLAGHRDRRLSENYFEPWTYNFSWVSHRYQKCLRSFWPPTELGLFLGCAHVMRRTCWCTKQWQNVAQVLHNNRTKFPKDFFHHCSVHQHGRRDVRYKPRILDLKTKAAWIGALNIFVHYIAKQFLASNEGQSCLSELGCGTKWRPVPQTYLAHLCRFELKGVNCVCWW